MSDNVDLPSSPNTDPSASKVPAFYVGRKLPAGVQRIIRVDRKRHVDNAWRVAAHYPTAIVIEKGQPNRYYHQIMFTNGILTEYKDETGNWVLGIMTDSELICYTQPELDPINPATLPGGC